MPLIEKKRKEPRSCVLPPLRLTKEEHALIQRKSASSGVSLSQFVRDCCVQGFVVGQKPIADITLIKELKRLGSNFNQYQHKLNSLHMDSPQEVKRVSSKIEHILDALMGIESGSKN